MAAGDRYRPAIMAFVSGEVSLQGSLGYTVVL